MSSAQPLPTAPSAAEAPPAMVRAVRPDGQVVELPQTSLDDALQRGYRVQTPEQAVATDNDAKYGGTGGELTAAALGAARGLTFGVSDLALRATGIETPEELRGYQETNPTSSAVGEFAGVAGGLLGPGAVGRVVGAGVRGAGLLGEAVADVVAGGAARAGLRAAEGGLAKRLAAGALPIVTRGVVEGAVYGVGQGISHEAMTEADLGHPHDVAQVLLAHASMGALFGGATSLAIGGTTALGAAGARRVLRAFATSDAPSLAAAVSRDAAGAPPIADVPPVKRPSAPPPAPTDPLDELSDDAYQEAVDGLEDGHWRKSEPGRERSVRLRAIAQQKRGIPMVSPLELKQGDASFVAGPFSPAELDAMGESINGGKGLNSQLRMGPESDAPVPTRLWAEKMDAAINKSVVADPAEVYRGLGLQWAGDYDVGSTFVDRAFQSFSSDVNAADGFATRLGGDGAVFRLRLAPGDNALPISKLTPDEVLYGRSADLVGENEVLLPRNTRLRVDKVERRPDKATLVDVSIDRAPDAAPDLVMPRASSEGVPLDHVEAKSSGLMGKVRDAALRFAGGSVANAASITSGVETSFLKSMMAPGPAGERLRQVAFEGEAIADAHTRGVASLLTNIEDRTHAVMNATLGEMKADVARKMVPKGIGADQIQASRAAVDAAESWIASRRTPQYAGGFRPGLKQMTADVEAARVKLDSIPVDAPDAGARAFIVMDEFKRAIGSMAKPRGNMQYNTRRIAKQAQEEVYDGSLKPFLERRDLWGQAGTTIQAGMNESWHRLLGKYQIFKKAFMTEHGTALDDPWATRDVADPAKLQAFFSDAGNVRNDLKHELMTDHIDALVDFAKKARDYYGLQGKPLAAAEGIIKDAAAARASIRQAVEDSGVRNMARQLNGTMTGKALALMARMDKTLGFGPEVRAELTRELRRTADGIGGRQGRDTAEKIAEKVDEIHAEMVKQSELGAVGSTLRTTIRAVGKAVDATLSAGHKAERLGIAEAVAATKHYGLAADDDGEDAQSPAATRGIKRVLRRVYRYQAQPQALADDLAKQTAGLARVAPEVAANVVATGAQAMGYMAETAPRPPNYALTPGQREMWEPSPREAVAFSARLRAIMDPMSVPADLAAGTLRPEGVEALGAVYPTLHDTILGILTTRLASRRDVPFAVRQRVSYLFGQPTDGMTDPALGNFIAMAGGATGAPPDTGTGRFSPTDRTTLKNRTATAAQRIGGI